MARTTALLIVALLMTSPAAALAEQEEAAKRDRVAERSQPRTLKSPRRGRPRRGST
jgi:hypothetical protein